MLLQVTAFSARASDCDGSTTVQSIGQKAGRADLSPGLGTETLRVGRTSKLRKFLEATAL